MGLIQATFAAIGLFALFQWFVIPRLRQTLSAPFPAKPLGWMTAIMLASILRTASFIAALTFGAILITLSVATMLGASLSADNLAGIFRSLSAAREAVERLHVAWGLIAIGLLSIALWLSVRRDAKRRLADAVSNSLENSRNRSKPARYRNLRRRPKCLLSPRNSMKPRGNSTLRKPKL